MAGHVFVTHGDLTALACDAWLMPCDARPHVRRHWYEASQGKGWKPDTSSVKIDDKQARVAWVTNWSKEGPKPCLANTGGVPSTNVGWYAKGVSDFIAKCAPSVRAEPYLRGRSKPLLALPLVGTDGGGAAEHAGEIVNALLPCLYTGAREHDVDIAMVVLDGAAHGAAIKARREYAKTNAAWPSELTPSLRENADKLAADAQLGRLVLFLGAGLGVAANLPDWNGLLRELAGKAGIGGASGDAISDLGLLDFLDQARLIDMRLRRDGTSIGAEVSKLVGDRQLVSLDHQLLASLPVNETVTTNYDCLFEHACKVIKRPVRVLPYDPSNSSVRWLLKMHGCVSHPEDVVLTRSDFIRYDHNRNALRGIVQALLITKHMLFVGFSLRDENFQRIIDEVRVAIRGDRSSFNHKFGSVLSLQANRLLQEIWSEDLGWVVFSEADQPHDEQSQASAARLQEIFLDYLASHATSLSCHLLNPKYDAVLSDGERAFRNSLQEFMQTVPPSAKATPAWEQFQELLGSMGLHRWNGIEPED